MWLGINVYYDCISYEQVWMKEKVGSHCVLNSKDRNHILCQSSDMVGFRAEETRLRT